LERPERRRIQPDRITPEIKAGRKRARVATALAWSIATYDGFALLAVDEIKMRGPFVSSQTINEQGRLRTSHCKYMVQCAKNAERRKGEHEELRSIAKCQVWTKESLPPDKKVMPLKWVYKVKNNQDGSVARYKCLLVAQGFYQVFGENSFQTCSPVAKFTSIQMALAISGQLGLTIMQMDVDTDFLNAEIVQQIWVMVPERTPVSEADDGVYSL
jgi:Reverse transcriptase (RNA-dependent DNA polymerase)